MDPSHCVLCHFWQSLHFRYDRQFALIIAKPKKGQRGMNTMDLLLRVSDCAIAFFMCPRLIAIAFPPMTSAVTSQSRSRLRKRKRLARYKFLSLLKIDRLEENKFGAITVCTTQIPTYS